MSLRSSGRVTALALLAGLSMLGPSGAHAGSFQSAEIETTCGLPTGWTPSGPYNAPTSLCTSSGTANVDGRFFLDMRIETPAGGMAPGQGSASTDALLRAYPTIDDSPQRAEFDVGFVIDSLTIEATKSTPGLDSFQGNMYVGILAAHDGCFECFREYQIPVLDGPGSVSGYTRHVRIVMETDDGSPIPPGRLIFWVYPGLTVSSGIVAGTAHLSVSGTVGPIVRIS